MPARAISSGTISFGLVSIPVKIYTAAQSKAVRFSMLHAKDKARVKQQYVCSADGEVVPRDATVRGYEYSKDQYVVLSEDELKALEKKTDRTIEIEEFVPISTVDPIYFEHANLLGPDKGGHKAYRLLLSAMSDSEKVAVGRYSTRGREELVLVRPADGGLVLHGLYYADEVRRFEDIDVAADIDVKETELGLARQLIDTLSGDRFVADKYRDEYREEVLKAIDQKVAGEEITAAPAAPAEEKIIDLVAALKESLARKRAPARIGEEEEEPAADAAPARPRTRSGRRRSA